MIYIVAGYVVEGDYFYPKLLFPDSGAKQVDRTIPLLNAKTALKYANIWRNERLTHLKKYMPDTTKDYISVLEAFKAKQAQELAEKKEAQELQEAKAAARKAAALRPAVELFEQLFERYKTTRGSRILHRESETSLHFKVHWGYVVAGIYYGKLLPSEPCSEEVQLGLRMGWRSDNGGDPAFEKIVAENEVHRLFPELLSGLAAMELKYPQWVPPVE